MCGTRRAPTVVLTDFEPPASLEGRCCVYVLVLQAAGAAAAAASKADPDPGVFPGARLYVGETESIRQRLAQHRQQRQRLQPAQTVVACVAAAVPNKVRARSPNCLSVQHFRLAPLRFLSIPSFDSQTDHHNITILHHRCLMVSCFTFSFLPSHSCIEYSSGFRISADSNAAGGRVRHGGLHRRRACTLQQRRMS